MKLLFESWRKHLEEVETQLPTAINAEEKYNAYRIHLKAAIKELQTIREMFDRRGSDVQPINELLSTLGESLEDEILKLDVENL